MGINFIDCSSWHRAEVRFPLQLKCTQLSRQQCMLHPVPSMEHAVLLRASISVPGRSWGSHCTTKPEIRLWCTTGTVEPRKSYLKSSRHAYACILFIYSKFYEVPSRVLSWGKKFRACMHSGASRLYCLEWMSAAQVQFLILSSFRAASNQKKKIFTVKNILVIAELEAGNNNTSRCLKRKKNEKPFCRIYD